MNCWQQFNLLEFICVILHIHYQGHVHKYSAGWNRTLCIGRIATCIIEKWWESIRNIEQFNVINCLNKISISNVHTYLLTYVRKITVCLKVFLNLISGLWSNMWLESTYLVRFIGKYVLYIWLILFIRCVTRDACYLYINTKLLKDRARERASARGIFSMMPRWIAI